LLTCRWLLFLKENLTITRLLKHRNCFIFVIHCNLCFMMKLKFLCVAIAMMLISQIQAVHLLIPMDDSQRNHLKSYGIAYWVLQRDSEVKWLLNYRGGSFLIQHYPEIESECVGRGISFESITDTQASALVNEISQPEV